MAMAASMINNSIQVYFDSVFSMEDEGMVQMFKALESSGLRGFLGCSSAIYESTLVDLFHNASVRDNKVISAVQGKYVEISEEDMVTPASKQARGFAVQICIILKGAPDLDLGESKAFPPLKILTTKTVGTYIAKNKNITVEEVVDELWRQLPRRPTKRRPDPAVVESAAKKKRKTVGRAAPVEKNLSIVTVAQDVEPISVLTETAEVEDVETDLEEPVVMKTAGVEPVETEKGPLVDAEKEKEKNKEKTIDSSDTEPLSKVLELTEKSTSDEESMSIDDILKRIPEEMMLPFYAAAEPTKITFGSGIEIRDRDCLRRLTILESVSDIAAKEEQILAWAETASLQNAVKRRMYIIAKYREMMLRKFLEARHSNLESGTPTTAIDLQVLEMLSEAHHLALSTLMVQMRRHKLKWIRPSALNLFEGAYVYASSLPPLHTRRHRRRLAPPPRVAGIRSGRFDEENPFVQNSSVLLVQADEGVSVLVVDRIGDYLPQSTEKSRVLVIPVGARHKCQQDLEIGRPNAAMHGGPLISTPRALARTGRALAARPRERRREMLQQAQEVAPTSGELAALCAADDGRRLLRFVSCDRACVVLLAARCLLLDAPLGRRCATLARAMLRPGTPCVAREFFVWRSPAGRRSGESPAMS
ncbi:hypothetical protein F511_33223 [Dorcoceras hygrometricum]|uniref:Splicing factor 3B subunit 1-like n=1 Tax=Dorcoceras hygrometricum TaxID=472368 RepID=A0A2Z7AJR1_9LAMI|nr:hypothetical protein F511_33223 [Dorcoceras hygrometricum]